MAATTFHTRSNSLPSKPHPLISQLDEQIWSLRDSQAASISSSSWMLGRNLCSLQDLHECVDQLLLLPSTRQALVQECGKKCFDDVLDGSLRLLDLCNAIKDALLQTREEVHELQSVIRRRHGGLEGEITKHMAFRKSTKKIMQKALKNLKSLSSSNNEGSDVIRTLRDVEAICANVFGTMLFFICGSTMKSKTNKWSLVSKLMKSHRIVESEAAAANGVNEFAIVDNILESTVTFKTSKHEDKKHVINHLSKLDSCIQDFEDKMDCLFRLIIKTRVSLLNIIN